MQLTTSNSPRSALNFINKNKFIDTININTHNYGQ